jgi:molybdopterin synthase sulfur carrier subunit
MKVKVKLFSYFKTDRFHDDWMDLPENSSIKDLLKLLIISADDVGIAVVNKKDAAFNHVLKDGDVLTLIPVIGGG